MQLNEQNNIFEEQGVDGEQFADLDDFEFVNEHEGNQIK